MRLRAPLQAESVMSSAAADEEERLDEVEFFLSMIGQVKLGP